MATTPPTAGCKLAFDVTNLDVTCAFYRLLGFEVAVINRAGQLFESRELTSPQFPGVRLIPRAAFGKRPCGMSPGTVTSFGLPTTDLPGAIRRLVGKTRWVSANPEATPDDPRESVVLLDPDAYYIELYRA